MKNPIADFLRLCALALALTILCSGCSKEPKPKPVAPSKSEAKEDTVAESPTAAQDNKKRKGSKPAARKPEKVVAGASNTETPRGTKKQVDDGAKMPKGEAKADAPAKPGNVNAPVASKGAGGTPQPPPRPRPVPTTNQPPKAGPLRNQAPKVEAAQIVPLDITALVVKKDLEKALSAKKGFIELPLVGQPPSPNYNHIRLVPRGAGPVLGLTIQVWRDHTIANARRKYSGFLKSYPGAAENRSVTNRTFFARYGDNLYLGFFALRERTNIVLTCNQSVCDAETLHKAGLATKKRLPMFTKI